MLPTRRYLYGSTRHICLRLSRLINSINTSSGRLASARRAASTDGRPNPQSGNEPLGRGFYVAIAAIPLSFALYKFSHSSDDGMADSAPPAFTRMIKYYSNWQERWTQRNQLHTSMIEQAAHDRNLFQSSPGSKHIDLRFPEIFNTGSPYNVPAGHTANLDELIAHYKKINADVNMAREARSKAAERGDKEPEAKDIVRSGTY